MEGGWYYVIGTTFAGMPLSSDNKISGQAKPMAFKALDEIVYILHNDIRAENVLWLYRLGVPNRL